MNLFSWIKEKTFGLTMEGVTTDVILATIFYKEFALQSCISIIANALVLSEFQTYEKGKKTRKDMYHLLNVQPNKNQNAVEFWTDAISKLVYDNECLIIMYDNQLFVADEFTQKPYVLYGDRYTGVTVRGYSFNQTFQEDEVMYLKLNNKNIKLILDGLYTDYSVMLTSAIKNYKKASGSKFTLEIDAMMSQMQNQKEEIEKMMNGQFKNFIESDSGVMPLSKGMKATELKDRSISKDSRDVRHLVDDIIDFICSALHVPSGIVKGNVVGVSEQTDNFLMFGLNPIAKLVTTELNRKLYNKAQYLERTYVKVDTQKIRLVDLEKVSKAAEVLFRIGVNSIDDNLELVGREALGEEWSEERYVTKNYNKVLDQTNLSTEIDLKGGDDNGTDGKENGEPGDS